MKSIILFFALSLITLCDQSPIVVSVTGSGIISATPDLALFSVTVTAT
jgi:uncharacterized protein YggE